MDPEYNYELKVKELIAKRYEEFWIDSNTKWNLTSQENEKLKIVFIDDQFFESLVNSLQKMFDENNIEGINNSGIIIGYKIQFEQECSQIIEFQTNVLIYLINEIPRYKSSNNKSIPVLLEFIDNITFSNHFLITNLISFIPPLFEAINSNLFIFRSKFFTNILMDFFVDLSINYENESIMTALLNFQSSDSWNMINLYLSIIAKLINSSYPEHLDFISQVLSTLLEITNETIIIPVPIITFWISFCKKYTLEELENFEIIPKSVVFLFLCLYRNIIEEAQFLSAIAYFLDNPLDLISHYIFITILIEYSKRQEEKLSPSHSVFEKFILPNIVHFLSEPPQFNESNFRYLYFKKIIELIILALKCGCLSIDLCLLILDFFWNIQNINLSPYEIRSNIFKIINEIYFSLSDDLKAKRSIEIVEILIRFFHFEYMEGDSFMILMNDCIQHITFQNNPDFIEQKIIPFLIEELESDSNIFDNVIENTDEKDVQIQFGYLLDIALKVKEVIQRNFGN